MAVAAILVGLTASLASSPLAAEPRIINGIESIDGRWPSLVSVRVQGEAACGGTVIAPSYVLTAAHCLYDGRTSALIPAGSFSVSVGSNDRSAGTVIAVDSYIKHDGFSFGANFDNDIALLHLAAPTTQPAARLAVPQTDAKWATVGAAVTVAGWGNMIQDAQSLYAPQRLRQTNLVVVDQTACAANRLNPITGNMICAADNAAFTNATGPCNGDSGGPLFSTDAQGQAIQTGIVSFGKTGCGGGTPPVFTRVANYTNWIAARVPTAIFASTVQSGWWMQPGDDGRGFAVDLRGDQLYFGAFMYRADAVGTPVWYTALAIRDPSSGAFVGDLKEYAGGAPYFATNKPPTSATTVGTVRLTFTSDTTGIFQVGPRVYLVQRFAFVSGGVATGTAAGFPEAGWYANPANPGSALFVEVQGTTAYLVAATFDDTGAAVWRYVLTPVYATTNLSGSIYTEYFGGLAECMFGPSLNAPPTATSCGTKSTPDMLLRFSSPIQANIQQPSGGLANLTRFRF